MIQELKGRQFSLHHQFEDNKREFVEILNKIKDNPIETIENRKQASVKQLERRKTQASFENTKSVAKEYDTLMTKYRTFETKTEEIIPKLLKKYENEWKIVEKDWYNWNIEKVMGWFAYVLTKNGSVSDSNVDFVSIQSYLEKISFDAKYFTSIDDTDLSKYGFKNENDCDLLYEHICDLIEKYPKPKRRPKKSGLKAEKEFEDKKYEEKESTGAISNSNDKPIKKEYLCPISQKIMKNPVIAFDGNTYEKENIIKYLNDNGKMPNNIETISNVEMAIADLTSNRVLKQEIEQIDRCNDDVEQEDFDIDLIAPGGCATQTEKEKQEVDGDDQEPPKKRQRIG